RKGAVKKPSDAGRSAAFETLAVHAGQAPDAITGAVMEPIVLATTYAQPEPGKPLRFDYSRSGNPTRAALEACLAALEGGTHGFPVASGCAAATTLLNTLRPGDHVVCGDDVYGGTYRIFTAVMRPLGVEASFIDLRTLANLEASITDHTRIVCLESPSHPLLRLLGIRAAAAISTVRGALLGLGTAVACPPHPSRLDLGATVVLHSTTKYINGQSDVVGGALVTRDAELAARIAFLQNAIGAVPSPMDCYLVLRGLKTLPVRMQRHAETAAE